MDRRAFLQTAAVAAALQGVRAKAETAQDKLAISLDSIADDTIRTGVKMAIDKTLVPAAAERAYPGHFSVTADGRVYGAENTWPGLDSWELAGAYLLLGKRRMVLDYFDFVRASQRRDGNVPFAIFPAETPPPGLTTHLQGMRYPEDVYAYTPPERDGQPAHSNRSARKWIGLFSHWQPKVNPLGLLDTLSYILTADEIYADEPSNEWLADRIDSIDNAGRYVLARRGENGLFGGAGFYLELPPRNQWDGVTQCYAVKSFRILSKLHAALGNADKEREWRDLADRHAETFRSVFWKDDHFAEYVHPDHGLVDLHGLTDVNWAAIACDVATGEQKKAVWPLLMAEKEFWHGDMPTQLVTKPYSYRDWELPEPLTFHNGAGDFKDVAAMGRVWYLEAMACKAMGETKRIVEGVRKVCERGKQDDWWWYERYFPVPDWKVATIGPAGYCEYAAILVRVVLGNMAVFTAP